MLNYTLAILYLESTPNKRIPVSDICHCTRAPRTSPHQMVDLRGSSDGVGVVKDYNLGSCPHRKHRGRRVLSAEYSAVLSLL